MMISSSPGCGAGNVSSARRHAKRSGRGPSTASRQLRPPSVETSTFATGTCPLQAWPRSISGSPSLDATPFTRLSKGQIRRRWFPKVTVTVLEPVKLSVDPALKGKHRRIAAGAALYEIMSNLIYRTTSIDRTVPEALIDHVITAMRRTSIRGKKVSVKKYDGD